MPPELRKRKAPAVEPAAAPPAKKKGPVAKVVAKVKEVLNPKASSTNGAASSASITVGETLSLEGFGGVIKTHDDEETTLKKLVDESKAGVVLFTYPKASTPGCTTQACLFRDSYTPLTATGFSIYGLSKDSTAANTNFKEKQKLPYPLLCDVSGTLISAIGLKKAPSGTVRGVFVVDKSGKVLAAERGSPAGTVDVVKKLVDGGAAAPEPVAPEPAASEPAASEPAAPVPAPAVVEEPKTEAVNGATKEEVTQAETAAEVADTAEKIDSTEEKPAAA